MRHAFPMIKRDVRTRKITTRLRPHLPRVSRQLGA